MRRWTLRAVYCIPVLTRPTRARRSNDKHHVCFPTAVLERLENKGIPMRWFSHMNRCCPFSADLLQLCDKQGGARQPAPNLRNHTELQQTFFLSLSRFSGGTDHLQVSQLEHALNSSQPEVISLVLLSSTPTAPQTRPLQDYRPFKQTLKTLPASIFAMESESHDENTTQAPAVFVSFASRRLCHRWS